VGAGDKARTRESQERRGDEVTRAAAGVPAEACCCANGNCTMVHPLCCEEQGCTPGGPGSDCSGPLPCCGNGITEGSEECDDGNANDTDSCRNDCTIPVCGDGIVDAQNGETCDPPGSPAGGNGNNCTGTCTSCGDSVVDAGEQCDDGNGNNADGCRNDCTIPVCGDGIVDPQNSETCDPPGSPAGGNGNNCTGT
jgi:cysteine-rich repeat protein